MWIVNYLSSYKLSQSVKIQPEILAYFNKNNTNFIIKGALIYRDNLTFGVLSNNSLNYISVMLSGVLYKHIELGYVYDYAKILNSTSVSQSIRLGFRIQ